MLYIDILIASSKRRAAEEAAIAAAERPANAGTAGKQLDYLEWLFVKHPNDKLATKDVGLAKSLEHGDGEQAAFEAWLSKARPSGDCTDVHEQWLRSDARAEFLEADADKNLAKPTKADPYAEAKAAFEDGELEFLNGSGKWLKWERLETPRMPDWSPDTLRRKPKPATITKEQPL